MGLQVLVDHESLVLLCNLDLVRSTSIPPMGRLTTSLYEVSVVPNAMCRFLIKVVAKDARAISSGQLNAATPGNSSPAKKLQRRAAAGRDVRDAIGDAGLGHRSD